MSVIRREIHKRAADSAVLQTGEGPDRLKKAAGSGMITRVESLIDGGKLVAYGAGVKTGTNPSEIQFCPTGD